MSKIMHAGRSLLELLLILAIGLVPVVSGLLVMVFQLEKKLAENARISVQEAVYSVDQSLDRMHATALNALPLAGKPCDQVASTLRDQVARLSMVRSLTLVSDGQAYCTSASDSLVDLSALPRPVTRSGWPMTRKCLPANCWSIFNCSTITPA